MATGLILQHDAKDDDKLEKGKGHFTFDGGNELQGSCVTWKIDRTTENSRKKKEGNI